MKLLTHWMHSRFGGKRGFLLYCRYTFLQIMFGKYTRYMEFPKGEVGRVVFVCKGNICRSALAEVVFKKETDFPVSSFGLDTTTDCNAHPPIIEEAARLGYDLRAHRTTNVSDFLARKNDLFVCTEPHHIEEIRVAIPDASILLLGALGAPQKVYIQDPYSGKPEYIRYIASYLESAVKVLSKQLGDLRR